MLLYIAMMDRIEMKFEMMSSTYRIEPLAIADRQPIADPPGIWNLFFLCICRQRNTPLPPPPHTRKNPRFATDCHSHKLAMRDCSRYVNIAKGSIFTCTLITELLSVFLLYVYRYIHVSCDPSFVITMGFTRNCLSFD